MIAAASRSRILMISLIAALRTTIMLSSEPVERSVFCTPLAIISTAEKTNTTKATPSMVIAVVKRRETELRTMYFREICITTLNDDSPQEPGAVKEIHHEAHEDHEGLG